MFPASAKEIAYTAIADADTAWITRMEQILVFLDYARSRMLVVYTAFSCLADWLIFASLEGRSGYWEWDILPDTATTCSVSFADSVSDSVLIFPTGLLSFLSSKRFEALNNQQSPCLFKEVEFRGFNVQSSATLSSKATRTPVFDRTHSWICRRWLRWCYCAFLQKPDDSQFLVISLPSLACLYL